MDNDKETKNNLSGQSDFTEGDTWYHRIRNSLRRKPSMITLGEARDRYFSGE